MVTLADAKAFLRLDADDDNTVVERLIAAAGDHLKSVGVDMDADPLPPSVEHAQYLLIGHFYENREAVSTEPTTAIALGVDRLIAPHRDLDAL
jgi:hypothetical protein